MQIFFLSDNPNDSADLLFKYDKNRANKQLLEGVQLLNNCCLSLGVVDRPKTINGNYYKKRNFPKVFQEWLIAGDGNLMWFYIFLDRLAVNLNNPKSAYPMAEYNNLACVTKLMAKVPNQETPFPNYAKSVVKGLDFTNIKPTTHAYNLYLFAQLN